MILANRYQIQKELTSKAGRITFLAQDTESQNLVIIKVLQFDNYFQWDNFKLFEREVKTLENLDNPSIPKYLDYFEVDEENIRGFALVQTYIDAPSLEQALKQGRKFTEAELIELAEKLLDILTYLHGQIPPVIHRDIKPSNILISNRSGNSVGDVYLVDFGSVQTVASKDSGTITIVGSYGYIPLEQFSGQTTPASDLYSLGMTLIYLITGVHPADLTQVNGRVEFKSSEISNKFSKWLVKMTEPYLDKRFDSAKTAITVLKSSDENSGDLLHLKPANSQIELYRDRHKLEIRSEKRSFLDPEGTSCLGIVLVGLFLLFISPVFGFFPICIIFMILICISRLRYYSLSRNQNIFKIQTIITIEQNGKFFISKSDIGESNYNSISKVRDIHFIAYNPGYIFNKYFDETGKEMKRGRVTIPPSLSIYSGANEYRVGNAQMSKAELQWLGKEISDFLDLDLQIIYPTPKVPPEPSCGGGC
ncbi:MAG: serine/threonine protein kinase [Moorea sp. SIO2B7]|nr:serine/threonine protein kinase [Moorena sp. SIO2B7]